MPKIYLYFTYTYIIYDTNATLWIEKLYGYSKTDDSYVFNKQSSFLCKQRRANHALSLSYEATGNVLSDAL